MRTIPLAAVFLAALALAACGKSEPAKPAAEAAKPVAAAPAAPPPPPAVEPKLSPDEQLLARVKAALRDTRKVDAQGVGASVAGGVVTLHGTAPSAEEKKAIGTFVAGIEGVRSVANNLVVIRGS